MKQCLFLCSLPCNCVQKARETLFFGKSEDWREKIYDNSSSNPYALQLLWFKSGRCCLFSFSQLYSSVHIQASMVTPSTSVYLQSRLTSMRKVAASVLCVCPHRKNQLQNRLDLFGIHIDTLHTHVSFTAFPASHTPGLTVFRHQFSFSLFDRCGELLHHPTLYLTNSCYCLISE